MELSLCPDWEKEKALQLARKNKNEDMMNRIAKRWLKDKLIRAWRAWRAFLEYLKDLKRRVREMVMFNNSIGKDEVRYKKLHRESTCVVTLYTC